MHSIDKTGYNRVSVEVLLIFNYNHWLNSFYHLPSNIQSAKTTSFLLLFSITMSNETVLLDHPKECVLARAIVMWLGQIVRGLSWVFMDASLPSSPYGLRALNLKCSILVLLHILYFLLCFNSLLKTSPGQA